MKAFYSYSTLHIIFLYVLFVSLNFIIYFIIFLYMFLTFTIFVSSSIYIIYYCLELQWMLLLFFFVIGTSIYRGLLNYLILNGWLSILLIIGILYSNSIFIILAIFGKIGYYPFFLLISFLYYCSSYLFIIFDLINKLSYFTSFLMILNISFEFSIYWISRSITFLWFIIYNITIKRISLFLLLIIWLFNGIYILFYYWFTWFSCYNRNILILFNITFIFYTIIY